MSKVGDFLNPLPEIGKALAGGAAAEAIVKADAFIAKYPILAAVLTGKRVDIRLSIEATVAE